MASEHLMLAAAAGTNLKGHGTLPSYERVSLAKHMKPSGHVSLLVPIGLVLLPPLVFSLVITPMTFAFHHSHMTTVKVIPIIGSIPWIWSLWNVRKHRKNHSDASWSFMSFLTFGFAQFTATILGDLNFWYNLQPFYEIDSMKTYTNIDPAQTTGYRIMDAGRVYFSANAKLDVDMGMSFTSWDNYCVAPITDANALGQNGTAQSGLNSYDLWAVGINCCTPDDPSFKCGEYNNPKARAGLRQVQMEQRGFLELAVEQATAAYNIKSDHPLFFYWVSDPDRQVAEFFETGYKYWVLALCLHFAMNFLMVIGFMALHYGRQFREQVAAQMIP